MSAALLSMRGVSKRFGGVLANDRVNFEAGGGEVHGLLGENGAGKSTLMKLAYGYHPLDGGEIWVDGKFAHIRNPADARRLGIGMVFQTFTLIPAFTVAENISLYIPGLPALINMRALENDIRDRAHRYGLDVDPSRVVGTLAAGQQQKVEILKLLVAGARVLIFDEPTSVLPPHEVESLFEVFARLKSDGLAVVFITHKLHEVLECADRISVMRRGMLTGTIPRVDASERQLLEMMFGAAGVEASALKATSPRIDAAPVLQLVHISSGGAGLPLHDIDLVLHPGEIVGVAGISGNGQRELGDVVFGLLPVISGRKLLFGTDATGWSVRRVRQAGVGFVPENPIYMAVAPGLTVAENFALASPQTYQRSGGLGMDWARLAEDMERAYRALDLEPPAPGTRCGELSGGNLQRFVLARELGRGPKVLVALYPTRGLDAMTTAHAQNLLLTARSSGAAVLLISQDLGELFALSDRLAVIRDGRLIEVGVPDHTTPLDVGRLMAAAA